MFCKPNIPLCCFAMIIAPFARGTTIIAIRTADRVVIGADSLVVVDDGSKPSKQMCKIIRNEQIGCTFAYSGSQNVNWGFDALQVGASACRTFGNLEAKATAFEASAAPQIRHFLVMDRQYRPQHYQRLINKGVAVGLFIAMEGGKAVVIQIGWELLSSGQIREMRIRSDQSLAKQIFKLGETDEIDLFLQQNAARWPSMEEVALVRKLVQIEFDALPKRVGGQISVLEINASGAMWINAGACK